MATARTLDQIIAELNPTYQPQVQSIQNQMGLIPGQIATGEAQLGARKDQAYENILSGARQRGTGVAFGGIPLGEQAKYAATEYMPALANLRTAGTNQATSLQDAINSINERRDTAAQNIRNIEVNRDYEAEQARITREWEAQQAELSRVESRKTAAAQQAQYSTMMDLINQQNTANTAKPLLPQITRDANKGYNFTDAYGTPINAKEYVMDYQSKGGALTFRNLLQQMANDGDSNAKIALDYVGDDAQFGNAPAQYKGALEALGATGTYIADAQRNITNTPVSRETSGQALDRNRYSGLYQMYGR